MATSGEVTAARGEDDRGRAADSPAHIPARGWRDILWRTWSEFNDDRILLVAAGVTFYGLLALFPALAAFVSLYGLFLDPGDINRHVTALSGFMPEAGLDIVRDQSQRIATQGGGTLGFTFAIGLATSLWSATAGVKAIMDALNIAYEEEEKRSFVALSAQALLLTLGAIAFLGLALAGLAVLPLVLQSLTFKSLGTTIASVGRWPLLALAVVSALAVLYRYGPSRAEAKLRWLSVGSIVAAGLWLAFSMLFSWYVANLADFNRTYGSLGAVIALMTWMWLSTAIILLGAELNAEIEPQTKRDTTTGPEQPMGERRARMADTVAETKG
jgi:membrane protein